MRLCAFQTIVFSLSFLPACLTSRPEPPPSPILIQPETILPQDFQKKTASQSEDVFQIPEKVLGVAVVNRSRAELREGPGTQFNLQDTILPEGTRVIVIDHSSIWRRVFAPTFKAWGWAHRQALKMTKQSEEFLSFQGKSLPKVFAARAIETAYNFKNLSQISVNIPKGAGFLKVRERQGKVLVILPETRSLLWLAKKDVP